MSTSHISDVVNTLGKKIEGHSASLGQLATEMGESAASTLHDAVEKTGARISDIGTRAQVLGRRSRRTFNRIVEDDPVPAVLIAAAFGYGISCLLHRRR